MEFVAIEPGIEIDGLFERSSIEAFEMARCVPAKILYGKGIGKRVNHKFQIDVRDWFPQQDCLDAFKEISLRLGDNALTKIGMKIPEIVSFPVPVKDIENALKLLDLVYHLNHRKNGRIMFEPNSGVMLEGIGHYSYSRNGDEHMIESDTPFPCALDMGILTTIAHKFNSNASIIHDDSTPCRKRGDKSCMYKIKY